MSEGMLGRGRNKLHGLVVSYPDFFAIIVIATSTCIGYLLNMTLVGLVFGVLVVILVIINSAWRDYHHSVKDTKKMGRYGL